MRISTRLRIVNNGFNGILLLVLFTLSSNLAFGQTTISWKGTTSTDWGVGSNWSTGVAPGPSDEVIIGNTAFTGNFQPTMNESSVVTVRRITLTNESGKNARLFVTNNFNLVVTEQLTIGSGTTLENEGSDIVIQGNIINNGAYVESEFIKNNGRKGRFYPSIEMSGAKTASFTPTIGGSVPMTVSHLKITGYVTLAQNLIVRTRDITVTGQNTPPTSDLTIVGTFDPSTYNVRFVGKGASATTKADGTNTLVVESGGTLMVMAATYAQNYISDVDGSGVPTAMNATLYVTSIVEYGSTAINQDILPRAYGILKISGTGRVKRLVGNTTVSNIDARTELLVVSGTLDLQNFTLNRTSGSTAVAGGTLTIANDAFLKIGGNGAFPTGFQTVSLGSISTVEYYGDAQNVAANTYGHLILSGTGTKTMPGTIFTVAGDFSSKGSVSYTANNNFTVLGDVTIGAGTTFNGSSRTITAGGNWINNGTFTPGTSTVVMNGSNKEVRRIEAGAVPFHHLNVTAGQVTAIVNVEAFGNLTTSGAGKFTSNADFTMSGTAGSITGEGIQFFNLFGNGTTTTAAALSVIGDITVNTGKSFTATGGVINMSGPNKKIINNGSLQFYSLRALSTITTNSNFNVSNNLSGTGQLTASAGTLTFNGTSTFGGTHNLHNVTVLNGQVLTLNSNSNLGIASTLATTGTINVNINTPNTITFNRNIVGEVQTIPSRDYFNLVVTNTGVKAAAGALNILNNFTVGTGFTAGSFTHQVGVNLTNNAGSNFNATGSTFRFVGTGNSVVTGNNTAFNVLQVLKTVTTSSLDLGSNIETNTLIVGSAAAEAGSVRTNSFSITVKNKRAGKGWVYGTIARVHSFKADTAYAFAGPFNTITLPNTTGITAVSVTNASGVVSSFSNGSAINRQYAISITGGSNYSGTLQLQYNDADLNGNNENLMQLYRATTPAGPWNAEGQTARNPTDNWINKTALTNVTGNWTLSESSGILRWAGTNNTNWNDGGNWLSVAENGSTSAANRVPTSTDIVELGGVAGVTNQPILSGPATIKALQFLDNGTVINLTLNGATAALTINGNLAAAGTAGTSRVSQVILNNSAASITVGGSVVLSNNAGNNISLDAGSATVTIVGELSQTNLSSEVKLGSGATLNIGGDYTYAVGVFTAAAGSTVNYNGAGSQVVAPVAYHHLTVSKASGVATLTSNANVVVNGNLTKSNGGTFAVRVSNIVEDTNSVSLTITGSVSQTGGDLDAGDAIMKVAGNWTRTAGNFLSATSTVEFVGATAASAGIVGGTEGDYTFNKLTINKTGGAVFTMNQNSRLNADLAIVTGTLNLGLKTLKRTAPGGKFTMAAGTTLLLENSNFPTDFLNVQLDNSSQVTYQGTGEQLVAPVTYGNLTFINGNASSTVKRLQAATTVNGTLGIAGNATLHGDGETLTMKGTFSLAAGGQFIAGDTYSEGALVLAPLTPGTSVTKYLIGNITVHNMLLEASADYLLMNGDGNSLTIKGDFNNQGTIAGTDRKATFEGNFINTGVLKSSGVAAFTGTREQTIQLRAPIEPYGINPLNSKPAPPTVEFNGFVPPVLNSTTAPQFGSVVINNTGGVTASVNWIVGGVLYVKPSAKFHGGSYTHTFATGIDNEGLITSTGTMNLSPIDQGIVSILPTKPYYPFKLGMSPSAFQSTGTLRIGGTEMLALLGFVPGILNNVIVENTNPAGVKGTSISDALGLSLHGNWDIKGNLTVAQGATFNTGTASQYMLPVPDSDPIPMASGFYTIGGNLTNNGTIDGTGADVTLTNAIGKANATPTAAIVSGIGSTSLGNLTIATGAGIILNKTVTLNGNLTYNGADFNATGGVVRFAGTSNSLVKAPTAGAISITSIIVEKSATANVALEANLHDVNRLQVLSGTLDLGTYEIVKPAVLAGEESQSEITVADNAMLKIGGKGNIPQLQLDKYTFAANSTVEYYGGNALSDVQPVLSVQYGNLSFKNLSTKTFDAGTAKIAGNFTVTSDPVVVTPATIEYNGTAAQTVAAINYKNLSLSTSSNKTLAAGTVGVAEAFTNTGGATVNTTANTTTVDYNGAAAQNVLAIYYHNLKLSNSGIKTFSNTTGVAAAFTVEGTAEANLTSSETTLDFNGTGAQNIPALTYSKVLISAGGTKALTGGNANIQKELRLTNGKITTSTNKFILGNTATIEESEGNYVTGLVETQRNMTTAMETFGKIGISVTPAVSPGTVTVLRETGKPITANGNTSILRNFLFTVAGTNSKLNATVTFNYFTDELGAIVENTLLLYYSSNGSDWMHNGSSVPDPANNRLGANGIQSLTRMTLGSSVSPLPVEMKYFRAERRGQEAVLSWETAAERDHQGFEVEVSVDGRSYRRLGFVASAGTGTGPGSKYGFTDTEVGKAGIRYYRLKQLDLDGTHAYYGPRAVDFGQAKAMPLQAYPNPFQDQLTVEFQVATNGVAKLSLHTIEGRKLYEENYAAKAGQNVVVLSFKNKTLKPGLYLMKVETGEGTQSIKVIKK